MTLNLQNRGSSIFLRFRVAAHISRVNFVQNYYYFIACCTLIAKVAGPLLSRVTWAFLKLLICFLPGGPFWPVSSHSTALCRSAIVFLTPCRPSRAACPIWCLFLDRLVSIRNQNILVSVILLDSLFPSLGLPFVKPQRSSHVLFYTYEMHIALL